MTFTTLTLLNLGCSVESDTFPSYSHEDIQEDSAAAVDTGPPAWECVPDEEFHDIHMGGTNGVSGAEYAEMCEPHLGIIPEMECSDGVLIPITVNGSESWDDLAHYSCDNYSLQSGQCTPGSTINRITGQTRVGEELSEVVWIVFCRTFSPGLAESDGSIAGSIQLLGYNYETGASCMFNGGALRNSHDGTVPNPAL